MKENQSKDPLHGKTLEAILDLPARALWLGGAQAVASASTASTITQVSSQASPSCAKLNGPGRK
jgi:hypothetical protein